ncbi:hypothetical protein [Tumebacillus permanentifrigoris]|uniref:Uncharacterized protein n=1 Tax=Tumebacillus permanentifrigoris TaxID=378543 RepID=A0A316D6G1_9BACL|nr:hypothetical protein [Tumebacillus permanentifrigoris]PWK10320.1 hypothetical protein C7459_112142 [Tumebacillus permanentifrigoris]
MENQIVIYRNISGETTRAQVDQWKARVARSGIQMEEKGKGKTLIFHLFLKDDEVIFYMYENGKSLHVLIEYMRVKKSDGRMVKMIDFLITDLQLRGEKYQTIRGELYRTLYLNGIVMDDGPFQERKLATDFDLRLSREILMGHIYRELDEYANAKRDGDTEREQESSERLRSFTEELQRLDEVLKNNRFNKET